MQGNQQVGPDDRKGGEGKLNYYGAGSQVGPDDRKGGEEKLDYYGALPKSTDQPGTTASNTTTNSIQNHGISEENEGILRNVYIYFVMVALNASVMASIILCWAQLYDVKVEAHAVWLASVLTGSAIYLMCIAFVFAVAIDVGQHFSFFVVSLVVGGVFFLFQTLVSIPLIIPPSANQIIERIASPLIYLLIFALYYFLDWLYFKLKKKEE
ncbi:hypothetical protein OIU79_031161 [Salix purpurea]|uniref:PGG domain-containing protein n=1 Tax=Salix purpurea TaxID=77065 RepID=A0A9Q0VA58_SALPP|nr:hypothetical protein OIU79_031161 [Salix purpurea]